MALPEPLEAREPDAAGVIVLLGSVLQLDVAVDREDPGALRRVNCEVLHNRRYRASLGRADSNHGVGSRLSTCAWVERMVGPSASRRGGGVCQGLRSLRPLRAR